MQPRTKKWLIIGGVAKLLVTVVLIVVFVLLPSPSVDHRIVDAPPGYEDSLLQLHENGSFNIMIVHEDTVLFSAIGRYSRTRYNLRLYFYEAWVRSGDMFTRDSTLIGGYRDFDIQGGRIRMVIERTGAVYYFRA